jgi:hypothetical protein
VDAEHLRTLCGFVGRDETLWFRKRERMRKGKPRIFEYASVGLRSARIVEDLRTNFKVVPRKSLVLEPPDVPQPMLRHFIRGIFDGDGSVGWHKHNRTVRFTVCSGSKRFVEWIRNILFMELGDLGMRTIGKHGDAQVNTLDLTGDAAVKVFEWMYSDGGEALCLKRKRERVLSGFERLKTMRAARASRRQATVDEMSTLYIQGLSYGEIAARLGATKGKVSYYLRGVDIPKRAGRTDSPAGQRSRERDQGMLASHLAGEGADGIAARFGIAESSFWVAIRRAKGPRTGQTGQG